MAQIQFEKMINLTTHRPNSPPAYVDKIAIGNEPNNNIFQYYLKGYNLRDKGGKVVYSNYSSLVWEDPASSMSTRQARSFGIKTFPGVGAIGFYEPLVGNSKILLPVHIKSNNKYDAPVLLMSDDGDTLTFTITQPDGVAYTCFRIILESGYNAFEYITYELTKEVPKPSVVGTYRAYCIGYVDEGSYISEDSNSFEFVVNEGTETIMPTVAAYASVEYVQQAIQSIMDLIDNT